MCYTVPYPIVSLEGSPVQVGGTDATPPFLESRNVNKIKRPVYGGWYAAALFQGNLTTALKIECFIISLPILDSFV